jgi:hypothetical protein
MFHRLERIRVVRAEALNLLPFLSYFRCRRTSDHSDFVQSAASIGSRD